MSTSKTSKQEKTLSTARSSIQETKPSRTVTASEADDSFGDSGTITLHGIIGEEYIGKLQGRNGVILYDEMRKSDATVRALLSALSLPIRRAEWFIKAGGTEKQDEEIKQFVEHCLFDWHDQSWDDFLRQALLMLAFGVTPFEKVFATKEWNGKDYMVFSKLAVRLPRSIQQWELTDGTFGIQQIRQDGQVAQIPGDKLVIFVNELEGSNWWGTSMLRACYRNWEMKKYLYKIEAASHERQGLGVPYAKMPPGAGENQEKKAAKILRNLRAHEKAFVTYPNNWEVGFLDMGSKSIRDQQPAIAHHNREIVKAGLAQFLDLGSQKTGSHALSSDQSSLFLKSLEAVANIITSTVNKQMIKQLVDFNYNGVVNYPAIDFAKIDPVEVDKISKAYLDLVQANGINPTKNDENYLRALLGLPEYDPDDEKETNNEDLETHLDYDPDDEGGEATKVNDVQNDVVPPGKGEDDTTGDMPPKKKAKQPAKMSEPGKFKPWRKLTFAEQKVNFQLIQTTLDKLEGDFKSTAGKELNAERDRFMAQASRAIQDEDQIGLKALEVQFTNDYKRILLAYMGEAYNFGKNSAAREIGIMPPIKDPEINQNLDLIAESAAKKTAADVEARAKLAIANASSRGVSKAQTIGMADKAMESTIDQSIETAGNTLISGSMNIGRNSIFADNPQNIYALQRSEILDSKTCNFCISMDGRIIEKDDDLAGQTIFHTNCRGIWVAILNDEENKPDISGVPQSIRNHFGGNINELIQPKNPIVKKDSLAAKFLAGRDKKK